MSCSLIMDGRKENTELFINEWYLAEPLWNTENPTYKNRDERNKCVQSIAERFQISENDVKSKIRNLRTYYVRELAKERSSNKSGAGSTDAYESKWPFYQSLQFLRDFVMPRKTSPSMVFNRDTSDLLNEDDDVVGATCSTKATEMMEPIDSENEVDEYVREPSKPTKHTLKRKYEETNNRREDFLHTVPLYLNSKSKTQKSTEDDSEEIFGKYIASELRNFTDIRTRQIVKFKLQELLTTYQIGMSPNEISPRQINTGGSIDLLSRSIRTNNVTHPP